MANGFIVVVHDPRLRVTFLRVGDEGVQGAEVGGRLHAEFRDEAARERGVQLIRKLGPVPDYSYSYPTV